jgi:hypothetical protein
MYRYFGSQLIRQQVEYVVVVDGLVIGPQEVKPAYDSILKLVWYSSQHHVRFHRVQFGLKKVNLKHYKKLTKIVKDG